MTATRQQPQMKIRLPAELKAAIEGSAQRNFRSMNNEILCRLVESLTRDVPQEVKHAHC